MPKSDLQKRIDELIEAHGGLRAAATAVDIDPSYFLRMRDGKSGGAPETLKKLGLRADVRYVTVRA